MKKTILVILTGLVAALSIFATVHAGADFDLSVRANSTQLAALADEPAYSSTDLPQLRFIAKPYYANGNIDVGLRFKFGFDSNNILFQFEGDEEPLTSPIYSFLKTTELYSEMFDDLDYSFIKYPLMVAEFIDHFTYNANGFVFGLNRDREMEVSTLATGKFAKEAFVNRLRESEISSESSSGDPIAEILAGLTSDTSIPYLTDPALSLVLSSKHDDFSFFSFVANVGDVEALLYNTAGAEVKFASSLKDGLKYKASVLAQGYPISVLSGSPCYEIIPDFAVSYETTRDNCPVTYTAEADAVIYDNELAGFAAQFGSSAKINKLTLDSDIYVVKNFTSATDSELPFLPSPAFRNANLDTSSESGGLYAIGTDFTATVNFNDSGKMYLGTGFGVKGGLNEITSPITIGPEASIEKGAEKLDYVKAGLKFGDMAWLGFDAEIDYFYTTLLSTLLEPAASDELGFVNNLHLGLSLGSKFDNGSWELSFRNVDKETASMFNVEGSFKMTYRLGN